MSVGQSLTCNIMGWGASQPPARPVGPRAGTNTASVSVPRLCRAQACGR